MMRALRAVSTERGRDVRKFTLYAFGGSGPVHGANLAAALQMPQAVIPRFPGLFSAYGLLCSRIEHRLVQTTLRRLGECDAAELAARFERMAGEARAALVRQGYAASRIRIEHSADLRYAGQQFELEVGVAAPLNLEVLAKTFHAEHERTYGHVSKQPVQLVNLRVAAVLDEALAPPAGQAQGNYRPAGGTRKVYFAQSDECLPVPVVSREELSQPRPGPLLVQEYDTTTVVPAGARVRLDAQGQTRIEFT
jgi:N-methylhydantoinase A